MIEFIDFATKKGEFETIDDEKIIEIIKDYYFEQLNIAEIINKYNLIVSVSEFREELPRLKSVYTCEKCGYSKNEKLPTKQSFKKFYFDYIKRANDENYYCLNCKHNRNDDKCCCSYCRIEIRENIENKYISTPSIQISDVSFDMQLALSTILQGMDIENGGDILCEEEWYKGTKLELFFNEDDYPKKEIDWLLEHNILTISSSSSLEAFDEETLEILDEGKLRYKLNNSLIDKFDDLKYFNIVDFDREIIPVKYRTFVELELFKIISKQFQFNNFSWSNHNYIKKQQIELLKEKIKELLIDYTPSQIYAIWYNSIKIAKENELKYGRLESFRDNDLKFVMSYGVKTYLKRHLDGKVPDYYEYPYWGKMSVISDIFFNKFIGTDWFTKRIIKR